MSHVVKIQAQIKDLDALEKACAHLGLTLVREASTFRYYAGNTAPCSHKITMPGTNYEIGVVKSGDASNPHYTLQTDFWDRRVGATIGADGSRLIQTYNAELVTADYNRRGFRVARSVDERGKITLRASR